MKRRQQPEAAMQRALIDHLENRGVRGLVYFAVPNGGKRSLIAGAQLKRMGVKAGVSDIILMRPLGTMCALELKTERGVATEDQVKFVGDVRASGGLAEIVYGLDHALQVLKKWNCIR